MNVKKGCRNQDHDGHHFHHINHYHDVDIEEEEEKEMMRRYKEEDKRLETQLVDALLDLLEEREPGSQVEFKGGYLW